MLKNLSFCLLLLASCNPFSNEETHLKATVYMPTPTAGTYNTFRVIHSEDIEESDIPIQFEAYVTQLPQMESIIKSDTLDVIVEPIQEPRYKLIDVTEWSSL